jgi:hypothetical protein
MPNMRKLNFSIEQDMDGYPPVNVESLWVKLLSNHLVEVDNIPFFTSEATVGDVVATHEDENGNLWFKKIYRKSNHSLIRIVFFNRDSTENVISQLIAMGCSTERMQEYNIVAVDVPSSVSIKIVQDFLNVQSANGCIDYEEALIRH